MTVREWPRTDNLGNNLDALVQSARALRACYVINPECADEIEARQRDYDAALRDTMESILSNVSTQAASTILAVILSPNDPKAIAHLDRVVDELVALLAPRVAELLEAGDRA